MKLRFRCLYLLLQSTVNKCDFEGVPHTVRRFQALSNQFHYFAMILTTCIMTMSDIDLVICQWITLPVWCLDLLCSWNTCEVAKESAGSAEDECANTIARFRCLSSVKKWSWKVWDRPWVCEYIFLKTETASRLRKSRSWCVQGSLGTRVSRRSG